MEVACEREEDEVMGMDLETTRKKWSHQSHLSQKPISPTNSDTSCVSTESSSDSNNFEQFSSLNNGNNITANGENHKVTYEVASPVIEEEPAQKVEIFAEIEDKNANFEGTNGFYVHKNGSNVVHSVRESNGGDKEMDVGSNGSSFCRSPDTVVGLEYVESLLDDSSNDVIPTDSFNGENGIISQNEKTGVHQAREAEPEVEEYDVERVIQKQETHDLYCPNCRSCITKRVILRRRKRKLPEVSTGEEPSRPGLDQGGLPEASDDITEESQQPPVVGQAPDSRLDAISCFSCFSIFVPTGEGFLCWRFKPKAHVTRHPDGTPTSAGQAEDAKTDSTGTIFPLWVVTCCQPAERKKPDADPSPHRTQPPLPSSDNLPLSSAPGTLNPEHSTGRPQIDGAQHGAGTTLQNKPLNPIRPYGDTPLSQTPSHPITTDEGSNFPLWILTCCQPSVVAKKTDYREKLDGTEAPQETPFALPGGTKPNHHVKPDGTAPPRETPSAPSAGTESDHLANPDVTVLQREPPSAPSIGTRPPLAPTDDTPIPLFKPKRPAIYVPDSGTSLPSKPIPPLKPNNDTPLPPQTGSSASPGSGVSAMPPKPQPPVIPPFSPGVGTLVDIEPGLTREPPRPSVSVLDIIKAIVYGGLLESITSLSVITSAAGGDATTLNILALGLANVFGGLVVLVHNLRVLKHEHTRERYETQLGRPEHYMLHAVVAIISYLVFGLMSPLIYGFSFRKSDNKDYKLATLAAAALACITLLSAAKAYVRDPPKGYIKTIFYYISLGFMVSGLGYVAGDVINMLLKKLGVFDSRAPDNVPGLATGVVNGAWSSY